ncbi:hypothetical protein BB559_002349 [Furculomyces boomerangus]|uniref:Uncharacterized protein n=1 Tax=Furculomyces boomerangus TaxID=61424 RepID=A0A2T9YW35_9FUNG|nr:hypothetical protein BB559_002349 [Furculomyces boomerangus]
MSKLFIGLESLYLDKRMKLNISLSVEFKRINLTAKVDLKTVFNGINLHESTPDTEGLKINRKVNDDTQQISRNIPSKNFDSENPNSSQLDPFYNQQLFDISRDGYESPEDKITSSDEDVECESDGQYEYDSLDFIQQVNFENKDFGFTEDNTSQEINNKKLNQIIETMTLYISIPLDASTSRGKEFLNSLTWTLDPFYNQQLFDISRDGYESPEDKITSSDEDVECESDGQYEYDSLDFIQQVNFENKDFGFTEDNTSQEINNKKLNQIIETMTLYISIPLDASTSRGKEFLNSLTWTVTNNKTEDAPDFYRGEARASGLSSLYMDSPLDIFLLFMKMSFWKKTTKKTNIYADKKKATSNKRI